MHICRYLQLTAGDRCLQFIAYICIVKTFCDWRTEGELSLARDERTEEIVRKGNVRRENVGHCMEHGRWRTLSVPAGESTPAAAYVMSADH